MSAASVTAYLSPTMARKRATSSGGSGGTAGCTHLRELLQQMATTAFQTINPAKVRRDMPAELEKRGSDVLDTRITEKWGGGNKILNSCLAYDDKGPLVKRRWPHLYKGPDVVVDAAAE